MAPKQQKLIKLTRTLVSIFQAYMNMSLIRHTSVKKVMFMITQRVRRY
jgi:hypothetical protein